MSCRPVPLTRCSVAELLDSFPQSSQARTGDSAQVEKYTALLSESVDDGRLTYEEADALTRQARLTRLTGPQLRELHQKAWEATYPETKDADWTALAPVQRSEMYLLADALGLSDLAERINDVIHACAEPEPPPEARYLRGLRVAIVGDDNDVIELRKHAECYGAKLAVNITKTVKWMVSATPDATDSRHTTARKLGIPIISPSQGWVRPRRSCPRSRTEGIPASARDRPSRRATPAASRRSRHLLAAFLATRRTRSRSRAGALVRVTLAIRRHHRWRPITTGSV